MTFVAATFRLRYFRSGDTGAATVYGLQLYFVIALLDIFLMKNRFLP
jgi:lipopolysaccharide export LptBFGC system permease protein LptF